ncbi:polysaccharide deacetylase family protein [Arenimonas sp.]|uniref:polysaccharide deacetylase family protein n=1 Tax=Arenimonas sp. TaxID=1872635 RepID=UPI0039E3A3B2
MLQRIVLVGLSLAAFAACAEPAATKPAEPRAIDRRIAITIDDLPWVSFGAGEDAPAADGKSIPAQVQEAHARLMAAIRKEAVPTIGFVNEGKLLVGDRVDTARVHLLRDWLDAGADLGNHTYGHADLHVVGLEAYEGEILRGELFLRPLLEERGRTPQWFRHPYLHSGRSAEDKKELQAFLEHNGYRIAPVTVDNSDWIWALAYRKTLGNAGIQPGLREETLDRLRREYLPYMLAKVDYYERQSLGLLGYNLPQVLLLHANEINADCYGELIAGLRARGYRFVALDEALQDPAYKRADAYTGRAGPSWLHRWAIGAKKPASFFDGEPKVADWVLQTAGIASE